MPSGLKQSKERLGASYKIISGTCRTAGFLTGLIAPVIVLKQTLGDLVTHIFMEESLPKELTSYGLSILGAFAISYSLNKFNVSTLPECGYIAGNELAIRLTGKRENRPYF